MMKVYQCNLCKKYKPNCRKIQYFNKEKPNGKIGFGCRDCLENSNNKEHQVKPEIDLAFLLNSGKAKIK